MEVKWTQDQQKVIDARESNILVAAAAGSGKTAVLVERIINRITDEKNPVDIDKMLIVTFTNAAASEMRERISEALEKKRIANPEDELLERQLTLVHNAQIATIDSFCLFVVRNHFEEINLDPNFRIADQGELELLYDEVLDRVFEMKYEMRDEGFLRLIDCYSNKGKDARIRDMVKSIYDHASSASWPKEWIEGLKSSYQINSIEEFGNQMIISHIVEESKVSLLEARELLQEAISLANKSAGMEKAAIFIGEEMIPFEHIEQIDSLSSLQDTVSKISFGRYPTIKEAENKEKVKNLRDMAKNIVADRVIERYSSLDINEIFEQTQRLAPFVISLVDLSMEYYVEMEEAKRNKKIVDFADIEHFALRIFVDEKTKQPTATAREFRKHFEEIMIDEYQDSNQVQEDILVSISRMEDGNNNMFMVGDVKQSIYSFRMAKPELFIEKYKSYSPEGKDNKLLIDLHQNFRSREEVLDFTNDMFYKLMHEDLGGVKYDNSAALNLGANYPESSSMKAEVLLFDEKGVDELDFLEETSKHQIEASMIADRIKELMASEQVVDKETKELRPVKYSDIVILLRSFSGLGDIIHNVLLDYGIPAQMQSKSGYFSAYEIQVLLDFLTILDNPYQDIPMATVLRSPIVGISDEKLANYALGEGSFAKHIVDAMKDENDELYEFGKIYEKLRTASVDTSIYKLLIMLLDETGFLNYVSCMPSGEKRKANVMMLLEKAITYEKTSYKGLFHFVKYIQKIKKYDLEGEADCVGEGTDAVRIMSIHKSKGLEFPIVFLASIHKNFNEMELKSPMIVHDSLGIGIHECLDEPKIKRKSVIRDVIEEQIVKENKGEELRILYVALTRAKEKLILTGYVKNKEALYKKAIGNAIPYEPISYSQRIDANSYLQWIFPAMLSYVGTANEYEIKWVEASDIILENARDFARMDISYLEKLTNIKEYSSNRKDEFDKAFSYEYPYQVSAGRKSKYSVSEIKHKEMVLNYDKDDMTELPTFIMEEKESYIPSFIKGDDSFEEATVNQGALRGTAMHRVMECLDFKAFLEKSEVLEFVEMELNRMLASSLITQEMYEFVQKDKICHFLEAEVGQRMVRADKAGLLFREKPFVMQHEEGFLVQGIIDVFWFEGDDIVLLDYKTDRVKTADELIKRYQVQLDLYADALQRVFTTKERKVNAKEKLIYSFALEEVIDL